MPLKIAAKVDAVDKDYFEHVVEDRIFPIPSNSSAKSRTRIKTNPGQRLRIPLPDRLARAPSASPWSRRWPVVRRWWRWTAAPFPEVVEDGVSKFISQSLFQIWIESVCTLSPPGQSGLS